LAGIFCFTTAEYWFSNTPTTNLPVQSKRMPRILVVDDDEALCNLLQEVLTDAGYEVRCARDGKAALKLYLQQTPDLVVIDLIMPTQEGLETILQMRRTNPAIKIIAISGGGHVAAKDYLAVAEKCGANRTLTKPFTPQEILAAIKGVLNEP
jgi:two-component system, chemotaxis family, chemotaxis protein CheY